MIERQVPMQGHPLTQAYLMGAKATDHATMQSFTRMAQFLELGLSPREIAQAKLAAEILIERQMP